MITLGRQMLTRGTLVCGLCTLLVFAAGCGHCKRPPPPGALQTIQGPLLVRYSLQINDNSTSGPIKEGVRMQQMQFFADFVILTGQDGTDSQLLPLSRIRGLAWQNIN